MDLAWNFLETTLAADFESGAGYDGKNTPVQGGAQHAPNLFVPLIRLDVRISRNDLNCVLPLSTCVDLRYYYFVARQNRRLPLPR